MFHRPNSQLKKPLTKYLQPNLNKANPIHTRSMAELNPSQSFNKENHFTSCMSSNGKENLNESKSQKSTSMNKMGRNGNNSKQKQPLGNMKKKNPQLFTCSISQMKVSQSNLQQGTNRSQKKNYENQRVVKECSSKDEDNYNLLLKLKDFIQELKLKEDKYLAKITQLENENESLREKLSLFEDRTRALEVRQAELIKKIKKIQNQKNTKNQCNQHELIIQSLKNVINEQLTKIITLQQEKLSQQNRQSVLSSRLSSAERKIENQEVYSFKKRKQADEDDSESEESFQNESFEGYQEGKKFKIPSPYNRVMETLENESEEITSTEEKQNDQILIEVGNYLSNFRKRK